MTQYTSNHTSPNKRRNTIIIIIIVVVLCLCLVIGTIIGVVLISRIASRNTQPSGSLEWGGAMTLVYRLDGQDEWLSAYIYDLEKSDIMLPAGQYYAEMKLRDGTIMAFNPLIISDEQDGKGSAAFKQRISKPINSDEAAQQIEDLVRFLVGVDNVRLTYFEIVSNGFQQPLFTNNNELTWDDEEKLMSTFTKLGDPQEVSAAMSAFITRAEATRSYQPIKPGLSAPTPGIINSVLSFFGIVDDENDIARQQVLDMYAAIKNPYELEESFSALDENQKAGAANFNEFIEKVRSGEIKDMIKVRRNLMELGPMEGIMMDLHPDSNRPGGEIIHRVGAEAVSRGAELNVEIIKEVLTITFPGMDQGFEYADKVNEWAEFIHQVYTDPLQAAGDELQGQVTDVIKDRIKTQFQTLFPEMDEDDVDELVDQVTEQVSESYSTVIEQIDEVEVQETQDQMASSETEATQENEDEIGETTPEAAETEIPDATPTEENSDNSSGPSVPQDEIVLPTELAEQQNDQNKDENSDFAWDAAGNCWNYVGPAFENYTWSCANQCWNYSDQYWQYDCTTDCPVYIGPDAQYWSWDCNTNCWLTTQPNYTYNCSTGCLEYTGPDSHLWYWDCRRSCLEYIGPKVDGYTWSCEWQRWVADD